MKPSVVILERFKERIYGALMECYKSLRQCHYLDLRLGASRVKSAYSENGQSKEMDEDYSFSFGIRAIAGKMPSWGFYGQTLGINDFQIGVLTRLILAGANTAYERAVANANKKCEFKSAAGSLTEVMLAKVKVCRDTIPAVFEIDPLKIPLQKLSKTSMDVSLRMKSHDPSVLFAAAEIKTGIFREQFFSSEGALIDQSFPLTQGLVYVVAQKGGSSPESYYDYVGDLRGWEVIEGKNVYNLSFSDFALEKTVDTIELSNAEFLETGKKEETVVTNPHFNTLLVHEIVGHPTEADRVLKMETAYAGRTWLFKDFKENQVGKRIASPLVNAFSDPSVMGYGYYKYDAEGTPGKRINVIENGVLKCFLNGRETAAILDHTPNGSMRATQPAMVPIVRMTNTAFGPGKKSPKKIIKEVDNGYYIVNHRTPSISESRENFRISAQKVYKIEKGKLTKLYRGGGIMADSKDFLMSIDAVGNDFKMYPIPNCGKGQPMQVMRVGNGGPTLRGRARLAGRS